MRDLNVHDHYFNWLYDEAFPIRDMSSPHSYTTVCHRMHQIAFKNLVPHDDNRIAEASELRTRFLNERFPLDPQDLADFMLPNASVLEVLIELARRADLMVPMIQGAWFRIFIKNLGLDVWDDRYAAIRVPGQIDRIIRKFNNRGYRPNGVGGIFPLRQFADDQRYVELWYQMGAYMTDNEMY